MRSIILGAGEIGSAYYEILRPYYPTWRIDVRPEVSDENAPRNIDILHVCLRYSDGFTNIVGDYVSEYAPRIINVMTTTPPGTVEKFGDRACHSTTRGLHPGISSFIMATPKHIGGPVAEQVAEYFRHVGIECITHARARTTEAAHILSNCLYGANILFAREMDSLCRAWGVDYYESVMRYSETHNQGYSKMGMISKMRPIIYPPGATVGGHCVTNNARLIPESMRGPIMAALADDGDMS